MTRSNATLARPRRPAAATMRRWDPFREIEDVYDRMGQLIEGYFGDAATHAMPGMGVLTDIEETDDSYVVDIDLPGVRPDDVNVELRDSELRITGEYQERERKGVLRRRSRRIGQFEHVIALPGDVDADKVDATLQDGVLTVKVGKASASRPRRIEIKGG